MAGPDNQVRFGDWSIDSGLFERGERLRSNGNTNYAETAQFLNNRKAAFFDLYKLEQYVAVVSISQGLFLWLTDNARYSFASQRRLSKFQHTRRPRYQPRNSID